MSSSSASGTNGTNTEDNRAPCTIGAFEPISSVAPRSLPGLSALGITLMQCMQRTHSLLLIVSFSPSQSMQRVGQRSQTSFWMSRPAAAYSATAASSCWMSSFQVPITERSARAAAATQSFGQPAHLILNLYGNGGRCSSS